MDQHKEQTSKKDREWRNSIFSTEMSLCHMYKCNILTDVTIQTSKKGVTMCFCAHKLVLALRSPVFESIFLQKIQKSNIIAMDDISPRALDILLGYIYSDILESDLIDELIESFEAAQKFEICSFYDVCVQKVIEKSFDICASNVCSVLKIANFTKSDQLRRMCLQVIEKEPENVMLAEDFLSVDQETICFMLKERNPKMSPKAIMRSLMHWMQHNKVMNKSILSSIDFSVFSIEEFLSVVQEFPNVLAGREVHRILSNLAQPGSLKLPRWCKFTRTKSHFQKVTLYQGMEFVKENAMQVVTDCSRKFSKLSFYNHHGFHHDILLKVVVSNCAHKLVMLELAFGSEYVPCDNLSIDLFCNIVKGKKMRPLKYYLMSCRRHYYLLLCSDSILKMGNDFNLLLKVKATELGSWMQDKPVSSHQFRVASVSNSNTSTIIPTITTKKFQTVCIKPFDDWLLFLDPESGSKYFVFSSLFFDTTENIQKYMRILKG